MEWVFFSSFCTGGLPGDSGRNWYAKRSDFGLLFSHSVIKGMLTANRVDMISDTITGLVYYLWI